MVVSSLPEKTLVGEAASALTAPVCPCKVAKHIRVSVSHTRTYKRFKLLMLHMDSSCAVSYAPQVQGN